MKFQSQKKSAAAQFISWFHQ